MELERKNFSISIDAPREKVWKTLWSDETYQKWTSAFAPGSKVETDWQVGSRAVFVDMNGDGMISVIDKKQEPEHMLFRHIGQIVDGKEDTDSDKVKDWAGAIEEYKLTEDAGVTTVSIDIDISPDYKEFFMKTWPRALEHLKSISEGRDFEE